MDPDVKAHIESLQAASADSIRAIVSVILKFVLDRAAEADEIEYGRWRIQSVSDVDEYITDLLTRESTVKNIVKYSYKQNLFVPPGHYYSPVVDASTVRLSQQDDLEGLRLDVAQQLANLADLAPYFNRPPFPENETEGCRYYSNNQFYGSGDALILSAIIAKFRPANIVEVGSGFSSAAILDTLDADPAIRANCTFIEPFPHRLKELLRSSDFVETTIIESGIQDVELSLFDNLNKNDVLFFDTTHICKTGSDVNHEIFKILPRLKSGVLVHFHDIFHLFEYPPSWVLKDNRSWNENYLIRAFLMYNPEFEVYMMTDALWKTFPNEMGSLDPAFARNAGAAIWLRRR